MAYKNIDDLRAFRRRWERTPKRRAYQRAWQRAHPRDLREYLRQYAKRPERLEARRAANRLDYQRRRTDVLEKNRVQRYVRRGVAGRYTLAEWQERLGYFAGRCGYCGSHTKIERDHLVPILMGGTNDIENIVPACMTCNRSKGPRSLIVWMLGRAA